MFGFGSKPKRKKGKSSVIVEYGYLVKFTDAKGVRHTETRVYAVKNGSEAKATIKKHNPGATRMSVTRFVSKKSKMPRF